MADAGKSNAASGGYDGIELDIQSEGGDQQTKEASTQTGTDKEGEKKGATKLTGRDVRRAASCFRHVFKFFWNLSQDDDDE